MTLLRITVLLCVVMAGCNDSKIHKAQTEYIDAVADVTIESLKKIVALEREVEERCEKAAKQSPEGAGEDWPTTSVEPGTTQTLEQNNFTRGDGASINKPVFPSLPQGEDCSSCQYIGQGSPHCGDNPSEDSKMIYEDKKCLRPGQGGACFKCRAQGEPIIDLKHKDECTCESPCYVMNPERKEWVSEQIPSQEDCTKGK